MHQIIDRDPGNVYLFYRDLRDVGFLIFQPDFWGRGLLHWYSGNPVWVELPLFPVGRGDGHNANRYFQAFVSWQLSLVVFCASSESQSSSSHILASVSEQRDCSLLSTELSRPL